MKTKLLFQKYGLAAAVILICTGVCLLFCFRKTGFFIDEIYSYGLANSYYAPYLSDVKEGDLAGTVFTRAEAEAYLAVGQEDAFAFGSVYYNQTQDVHPPLYYWILNAASSLAKGSCSKWIGLSINLTFYVLTLITLYILAKALFTSTAAAAAVTALYGLSPLATSAAVMIRMYMMLTFFTVLLALSAVKLLQAENKRPLYPMITLVIFLGMMTQYYFVFYAFFLCLACDLYMLRKRDFRGFAGFSLCAVTGVLLMVAVFPASLRQLFVGNGQVVGGASLLDTLRDTAAYGEHLRRFLEARTMLKAAGIVFLSAFLCCLPLLPRMKGKFPLLSLIVLLPAFAAFSVTAVISPVQEFRYIYNLIPVLVLSAGVPLCMLERAAGRFKGSELVKAAVTGLVVLAGLWNARQIPPAFLFYEMAEYDAAIAEHTHLPCVYITDKLSAPLTQDLLQLKQFNSFYVTYDPDSKELQDWLAEAEEAVIYIDTNPFWSSGYNAQDVLYSIALHSGFTEDELLYRYDFADNGGLSETYLIRK